MMRMGRPQRENLRSLPRTSARRTVYSAANTLQGLTWSSTAGPRSRERTTCLNSRGSSDPEPSPSAPLNARATPPTPCERMRSRIAASAPLYLGGRVHECQFQWVSARAGLQHGGTHCCPLRSLASQPVEQPIASYLVNSTHPSHTPPRLCPTHLSARSSSWISLSV